MISIITVTNVGGRLLKNEIGNWKRVFKSLVVDCNAEKQNRIYLNIMNKQDSGKSIVLLPPKESVLKPSRSDFKNFFVRNTFMFM